MKKSRTVERKGGPLLTRVYAAAAKTWWIEMDDGVLGRDIAGGTSSTPPLWRFWVVQWWTSVFAPGGFRGELIEAKIRMREMRDSCTRSRYYIKSKRVAGIGGVCDCDAGYCRWM